MVSYSSLLTHGARAFVLLASFAPSAAEARPERAPPVSLVARALGVPETNVAPLTPEQRDVAEAAGRRLISLCPDCRLSTIDVEGPCGWARAQRSVIKNAVAAGWGEDEIVKTYVATYGDQILAIETDRGFAAASWLVPMLVTVLSLGFLLVLGRRLTRNQRAAPIATTAEPTDIGSDRKTLEAELEAMDD